MQAGFHAMLNAAIVVVVVVVVVVSRSSATASTTAGSASASASATAATATVLGSTTTTHYYDDENLRRLLPLAMLRKISGANAEQRFDLHVDTRGVPNIRGPCSKDPISFGPILQFRVP